eukprot:TRINITY_DN2005_c0_g1_i1.p1 TRINITY_DN2005_c0_g1~~TRINITY_DN2005_c0_g1_i1.p1  ORF type:complete len:329 (-),score=100.17 TRINITY_DN2005_c0_g1_i1:63-980(-)
MTTVLQSQEQLPASAPTSAPQSLRKEHEWTLYYEKKSRAKVGKCLNKTDYLKELEPVGTFRNTENFWKTWNKVLEECNTKDDANYHMFKDDIKPIWEDPKNSKGGKWVISLQKEQASDEETIRLWMSLMLALVNGDWGVESEINGIVLQSRPWGSNFTIWNRNANDKAMIDVVSKKLQELFNVDNVKYQKHEAILRRNHIAPAPAPKKHSVNEEVKEAVKEPESIPSNTNANTVPNTKDKPDNKKVDNINNKKPKEKIATEPKANSTNAVVKNKKSQLPEIDIFKVGIVLGVGLIFSIISWTTYF